MSLSIPVTHSSIGTQQLLFCIIITSSVVHHSMWLVSFQGRCAQGQCHSRQHPEDGSKGWGGGVQVSQVCQHQAWPCPSLQVKDHHGWWIYSTSMPLFQTLKWVQSSACVMLEVCRCLLLVSSTLRWYSSVHHRIVVCWALLQYSVVSWCWVTAFWKYQMQQLKSLIQKKCKKEIVLPWNYIWFFRQFSNIFH